MIDQGRGTASVRLVRTSLYLPMRLLFRIEHRGTENIPVNGPLLVTPNHVTYFDPFWIAVRVYRTLRFMTWDRALAVPIGGRILRWLGAFPVSLENPESSAYRASLRILQAGQALMIFPEGGRSLDGRLQPLKKGAARLALKTGATILPVAVLGGHEVWGPQLTLPRPRKVVVEFLPPFAPPAVEERDRAAFESAASELTERIRAALEERLARHYRYSDGNCCSKWGLGR
jgi:1-acyl-sn-glycerol-3-phosphate acyltransferase